MRLEIREDQVYEARRTAAWLRDESDDSNHPEAEGLPGFDWWNELKEDDEGPVVSQSVHDAWADALDDAIARVERTGIYAEHPRAAAERELAATASALMLAKLAKRRSHGDWRNDTPAKLFERMTCEAMELESEARELRINMPLRGTPRLAGVLTRIIDEATDVMNTAAMVAEWAQRELEASNREGK